MNQKPVYVAITGLLSLALASCASSRLDATFGDAVRANMEAQIYDPVAATSPSAEPVMGTDGQRMEAVMEAHRGQAGSAENVTQPIVISVGQ